MLNITKLIVLVEKAPIIIDAAAKLIDAITAKNQANAAETVMEKIIEVLGGLTKDQIIDPDILLSNLHGLSIDKDFTLRGKKKSIKIQLGTI